ncbi:uncharacterized protein AMSG_02090 [Thecamonas trahens ATCC 50062]|uniref:C2 domain-containing protein n=1 Tax=Thecamonas trahens ATCC 50062 TaxID=461836 RepID=A0A0L0DX35_THETB|nr:hypothetical protein AMSG_02090 [Thecamonas trahens ATCC 50062]KNC56078.1 hypothetical protein AMSG_02090 [Thecamonas trahens ATCC 50062]|eukprot:XP_013761122.1 hypothetical protein AMSG_02090 [Thecamonas trahens ATCC 50062]
MGMGMGMGLDAGAGLGGMDLTELMGGDPSLARSMQVTDADLNDQSLLAELAALEAVAERAEPQASVSRSVPEMEARIQQLSQETTALKAAGDYVGARAAFAEVKTLKAAIADVEGRTSIALVDPTGGSAPATPAPPAQSSPSISSDDDDDAVQVQVTDADLNNPDLLGELAELCGHDIAPHSPARSPSPPPASKSDDEVEVEVTDADLNDPELLGELEGLGSGSGAHVVARPTPSDAERDASLAQLEAAKRECLSACKAAREAGDAAAEKAATDRYRQITAQIRKVKAGGHVSLLPTAAASPASPTPATRLAQLEAAKRECLSACKAAREAGDAAAEKAATDRYRQITAQIRKVKAGGHVSLLPTAAASPASPTPATRLAQLEAAKRECLSACKAAREAGDAAAEKAATDRYRQITAQIRKVKAGEPETPPEPDSSDDEPEVHVSDTDLNNPALLGELAALHGESSDAESESDANVQSAAPSLPQLEAAKRECVAACKAAREAGDAAAEQAATSRFRELSAQIRALKASGAASSDPVPAPSLAQLEAAKRECVAACKAAREAGDAAAEQAATSRFRELSAQIRALKASGAASSDPVPAPSLAQLEAAKRECVAACKAAREAGDAAAEQAATSRFRELSAQIRALKANVTEDSSPAPSPVAESVTPAHIDALARAYKKQAIAVKSQDMELAKLLLHVSKVLPWWLTAEAKAAGTPVPPAPTSLALDGSFQAQTKTAETQIRALETLRAKLEAQREATESLFEMAQATGDKSGGAKFRAMYNDVTLELGLVERAMAVGLPLLPTDLEHAELLYSFACPLLDENVCEVYISGVRELDKLSRSMSDYSPHLEIRFPYPSDEPQVKTTSTLSDLGEGLVWSHRFDLPRKRSTLRLAQRKRIAIVVVHSRFLRSDVELGRAEIPLEAILSKSQSTLTVPFSPPNSKKRTKAHVEVSLSVRYPFSETKTADRRKYAVDWISLYGRTSPLGGGGQAASASSSPAAKPAAPKSPAPASRPPPTSSAASDLPDSAIMDEHNCAANMVSAEVLSWYIEELGKEVASARARRLPHADALSTELEGAQFQLQILGVQVSTGQLTPADYVAKLRTKISSEITLAKQLRAAGNKRSALLTMKRIKLMKADVAQAQQAL